ncbi:hypothetical protein [Marmoricola sp. RAF53]|uniref:hypothetical protein n=1 Tax=Marmoricola sp. RAF53 TaxID=3233059 RepID=UPI003F994DDE
MLVAALAALSALALPAGAVGTGNPVVESPSPTAKHYAGYAGPFTVSFEDAPIAHYDWYVEQVPAGGGTPVPMTETRTYTWTGSGGKPQLPVSPLPAGTGYQFRVTDNAGHEATFPFTVLPGPAPACSVLIPSQVRVNAPVERVTGRLSPVCTTLRTAWAAWKVQHVTRGFADLLYFERNRTDTWSFYDDETLGTYAITANGARDADGEIVPQNTRRTVVRLDSRLALRGTRSGGRVVLTASLRRYLPGANGFRAWKGGRVVLAYRTCAACAWHRVTARSTSRSGVATFRVRARQVREYRVVAAGTPTTWAPVPKHLRR